MKLAHPKSIILATLLLPLCYFVSTSAVTYQDSVNLQFTFTPTITISITGSNDGNLVIPNLVPGDYQDSNIITVTASSNAVAGYSIYANTGSSNQSNNLINSSNSSYQFTSLATNTSISSLSDYQDNYWGYATSTNSGSTWSSYSGLPYASDSTSTSDSKEIYAGSTIGDASLLFKIGAKASSTQIAGAYGNTINFIALANENPTIVYMQDATLADCGNNMIDSRDNTIYTTALINDRCWMTKNLDLPGGTKLTSNDTDMPDDYTLPTANGFQSGDRLPESSQSGFLDNSIANIYNSNNTTCTVGAPCYSYYSWTTAALDSGRNITTNNTDAPYSICPKGWHLPNTRTGADSNSDFRALIIALGGSSTIQNYDSSTSPTGSEIYAKLIAPPYNFLKSGRFYDNSLLLDDAGFYWSATSSSSGGGLLLYFHTTSVSTAASDSRAVGRAIRCVLSQP